MRTMRRHSILPVRIAAVRRSRPKLRNHRPSRDAFDHPLHFRDGSLPPPPPRRPTTRPPRRAFASEPTGNGKHGMLSVTGKGLGPYAAFVTSCCCCCCFVSAWWWWNDSLSGTNQIDEEHLVIGASTSTSVVASEKKKKKNVVANVETKEKKFRVLVVGSGLTGCLTSLRIRQRLLSRPMTSCTIDSNSCGDDDDDDVTIPAVEVHVVERAKYPSGRFGAVARLSNSGKSSNSAAGGLPSPVVVANLGAQVLSTVNPMDPRSRIGGHGITPRDVDLAHHIVRRHFLSSSSSSSNTDGGGLLRLVPNRELGGTCERMIWEDLWLHYGPTAATMSTGGGMSVLLRTLLEDADVDSCRFGVRVDSVEVVVDNDGDSGDDDDDGASSSGRPSPSTTVLKVRGIARPDLTQQQQHQQQEAKPPIPEPPLLLLPPSSLNEKESTADDDGCATAAFAEDYDCVVLCVPAPEAARVLQLGNGGTETKPTTGGGGRSFFSDASRRVLRKVGYDSRTCEAHFYDHSLAPYLHEHVFRSPPRHSHHRIEEEDDNDDDEEEDDERYDDQEETTRNDDRRGRNIIELNVEHLETGIEYISWQDRYRLADEEEEQDAAVAPKQTKYCALVAHGIPAKAGEELGSLESSLDSTLAELIGPLSKDQISSKRVRKKSIMWETSQMIAPMEAIVSDPPSFSSFCDDDDYEHEDRCLEGGGDGAIVVDDRGEELLWQCLTSIDGSVIIAGDFMTQSSFLGCVGSADAAARAVLRRIALWKKRRGTEG